MVKVTGALGTEELENSTLSHMEFPPATVDSLSNMEIPRRLGQYSNEPTNTEDGPQSAASSCDDSFVVLGRSPPVDSLSCQNNVNESSLPKAMQSLSLNPSMPSVSSLSCFTDNGSVSPAPAPRLLSYTEKASTSSTSSSVFGPEDIQKKLDLLLEENMVLKETLFQNNLAMKAQMTTLANWREEVSKVHQNHKEKFQDTRNLVLQLQAEKSDMRKRIQEHEATISKLQNDKELISLQTMTPSQNEVELTAVVNKLTEQLRISEAALGAEVERGKIVQAELISVQEENKLLKKHIEDFSAVERHNNNYQQLQAKGFSLRVDELTAKLFSTEQLLESERRELNRLKALVEEKSQKGEEKQAASPETAAHPNAEATVQRLRLRMDQMTAQIVGQEDRLTCQARELESLREANTRLERENEAIPILKAQADVYQSDFLAEREARERLVNDKEQLAEDLRRLHRRNQELLNNQTRVPVVQSNELQEVGTEELRQDQPSNDSLPALARLYCPICFKGFQHLEPLEVHAETCLQLM